MTFEGNIQNIIQRTPTVKSFHIPRPEGFQFKAGQFMEAAIQVGDEQKTKYFTISSSPNEIAHIEFTKRITESAFSKALDQSQSGTWIKINGPIGLFTLAKAQGKVAFLSGGIGITPILSMCRYAAEEKLDKDMILLYGNRSSDEIPFFQEFEQLQEQNSSLRVVHTLDQPEDGWDGYVGYINKDLIKEEIPDYLERTFFVCGPPRMVEGIVNALVSDLHFSEAQIIVENFNGYN